jgi:uncharacterized protein YkwD
VKHALAAPLLLALTACGGAGSGGSSGAGDTSAIGIPSAKPTLPSGILVAGSVVALPAADATQTAALANAVVIVGPVPVTGATPAAQLPSGDVAVTTTAAGTFAATLAVTPAAATSTEPFVVPPDNLLGFTPPEAGYYIEVFGAGTDGKSAGMPIPLHRFVAVSSNVVLSVSITSAAEAAALASVNADRAANGSGPLTFDESAEEAARLHASDESANGYTCHYDAHNVGPSSRYLASGGIGLTGEGIALVSGSAAAAFAATEAAFLAEKAASPPGGHYLNLVDPAHAWAGLAAVTDASAPAFANVDYELITPNGVDAVTGASGYPVSAPCPPGTVVNNS